MTALVMDAAFRRQQCGPCRRGRHEACRGERSCECGCGGYPELAADAAPTRRHTVDLLGVDEL